MQPLDSKHNLPSEPSETEERLLLAIKLPDGQRIQRFFRPSDQLNSVLHFAENSSLSDFSEYDLVCNVPKVVFYDLTQCIQDTELKDRTVLYLEEKEWILSTVSRRSTIRDLWQTRVTWGPSSEFVSSSIPSWQIFTAHAQPFRVARDLAFCLKVPLDSLLVWASSRGSGETARMRRLAWTFAARIGDKY